MDTNGYGGFSTLAVRAEYEVVPVDFRPPELTVPGMRDLEIPFMLIYKGGGLLSAVGAFGGERAVYREGPPGEGGIGLDFGALPDHPGPPGADGIIRRNKKTGGIEIFVAPSISIVADGPGQDASGCWGGFPAITMSATEWRDIETRPLRPLTKPVEMPEAPECRGVMKVEVRAKVPELEAELEPSDAGAYRDWIPGFVDQRRGNLVAFRCRVKDGKRKVLFTFRLPQAEVSQEPGRCLNYPPPDTNDPEKYDLVFAAKEFQEEQDATISRDGLELRTKEEKTEAVAVVESRDYGAYGHIRCDVSSTPTDSRPVEAKDPKTGLTFLPIPRDEDGNRIADRWQELHGVMNKPADADDEENPSGQGHGHRGDGLTLYEEYRGFYEGGSHTRFTPAEPDPKRKDLYIRNLPGKVLAPGIRYFEGLSGLKVHDGIQDGEHRLRVVNFRSGFAHRVDQHAVTIVGFSEASEGALGTSVAYHRGGPGDPRQVGPPKNVEGIVLDGGLIYVPTSRELARQLAHELLHACCVRHHGEGDLANVPFRRGVDRVLHEDGREAELPDSVKTLPWVGVPHGQHSGDEDCVMRYSYASHYRRGEHLYYHCDREEVAGFSLCISPRGTKTAGTRYGDASRGRGNCASQICVCDAYDHSQP